jgi:hypothetical protein
MINGEVFPIGFGCAKEKTDTYCTGGLASMSIDNSKIEISLIQVLLLLSQVVVMKRLMTLLFSSAFSSTWRIEQAHL